MQYFDALWTSSYLIKSLSRVSRYIDRILSDESYLCLLEISVKQMKKEIPLKRIREQFV